MGQERYLQQLLPVSKNRKTNFLEMLFKANWLMISSTIYLLITPRSLFSSSDFSLVFWTCICSFLLTDAPQTQHVLNLIISLLHFIFPASLPLFPILVNNTILLIIKTNKQKQETS